MKRRNEEDAPQQKPRSGTTDPYIERPEEQDLQMNTNSNERANENVRNVPFEKNTDNTNKNSEAEITDGEAG